MTAILMFSKASSSVAPCDQHPGRLGHPTAIPSPVLYRTTGYFMDAIFLDVLRLHIGRIALRFRNWLSASLQPIEVKLHSLLYISFNILASGPGCDATGQIGSIGGKTSVRRLNYYQVFHPQTGYLFLVRSMPSDRNNRLLLPMRRSVLSSTLLYATLVHLNLARMLRGS